MGKVKPKYVQKFHSEWFKEKHFCDWINEMPGDSTKAFRKYYCCSIMAQHADLLNHAETEKKTSNGSQCSYNTAKIRRFWFYMYH